MQAGNVLCPAHGEQTFRIQYAISRLYVRIVQAIKYTVQHHVNSATRLNLSGDPSSYEQVGKVLS